jgi:hypothetical protein
LTKSKPHHQSQIEHKEEAQDWGVRGRERCSCGKVLKQNEEWHCHECGGKLDYYVVFDMFGGYIVHDNQMPAVTEDGQIYWRCRTVLFMVLSLRKKRKLCSKRRMKKEIECSLIEWE